MTDHKTTLGIIGTGNLATSIIRGLRQKSSTNWTIYLNDIDGEKASRLAKDFQASAVTLPDLVQKSSAIILSVKPNNMPEVTNTISRLICQPLYEYTSESLSHSSSEPSSHSSTESSVDPSSRTLPLLISVAAGLSMDFYETRLPQFPVIRSLPNTSALAGFSMTGLVRGRCVSDNQASLAAQIFETLGKILWIDDNKMNALTAVSGSGPAYFYYLAEAITQAGETLGLTSEESSFLAAQTLIGAGRMLEETRETPEALRNKVTSPNGTTHAAIESMRRSGLPAVILDAMTACRNRGDEMEKELNT
jgi:pyrroline-5-carboxylate reductase